MLPGVPSETVPEEASIDAPSDGDVVKLNEPPGVPVMVAVPPSHVADIVNDASSEFEATTIWLEDAPQELVLVVYVTS